MGRDADMLERLQKVMANAGVASRRHCEELITAGRVKVNGKVITELGLKVNPVKDKISVDDKPIAAERKVYILLNKPTGYVSTVTDPNGRRTVLQLVKGIEQRVYPVGRLDKDTSGLLILTNDGEFAYALTHPKHSVGKTYLAIVTGVPAQAKLNAMAKGLDLEDGLTAPAKVELLEEDGSNALLEITIHEGRNRQVRRMCDKIGHPVQKLKRIRIGNLALTGLGSGKFRFLNKNEIQALLKLAKG